MKYKTITSSTKIYFVSSVITEHKIIFTENEIASIPLNSLNWFCENEMWKLYAFCLMPNHIHFIVKLLNSNTIENLLARFHSFTGHEIINCLKKNGKKQLLNFFHTAAVDKKPDRDYLVWEDSVVKIIESQDVFLELIEYVHNNPVNKKWRLAATRTDYLYSSSCFYDKDTPPYIPVDDVSYIL